MIFRAVSSSRQHGRLYDHTFSPVLRQKGEETHHGADVALTLSTNPSILFVKLYLLTIFAQSSPHGPARSLKGCRSRPATSACVAQIACSVDETETGTLSLQG